MMACEATTSSEDHAMEHRSGGLSGPASTGRDGSRAHPDLLHGVALYASPGGCLWCLVR